MKQGLQLRLSQQLAMTPQLQQAIRLLQLSTLELQQELQQALESNPLLEQTDLHDEVEAKEVEDRESLDTVDALEQKEMPDELPLDASWDEIYTAGTPSGNGVDYQDDELPVYQGETTQTLQDYLMWQVELTPFTDTDRAIATSIVDAVDDTGYLTIQIEDIVAQIFRCDANRIKTLDSLEDRFHLLQADLVIADAVDNIFSVLIRLASQRKICATAC